MLIRKNNVIVPEKILNGLQTDFMGQKIHYFTKVASTNDIAKKFAVKGAKEGTVIIAETQSRGKGRFGRRWASPKGGIYFSIILRPKVSPQDALKLTFMAAVAVAKAIKKMFILSAEVKWPNDVLINGKKVCGILTEMSTRDDVVDFVVVGIGINANVNVDLFPEDLRSAVTSLKEEMAEEVDLELFLRVLLEELEHYYMVFMRREFDIILKEWRSLTKLLGAYVEVVSFDEKFEGLAIDVDSSGALIVKLRDGTLKKVVSGDVTYRSNEQSFSY